MKILLTILITVLVQSTMFAQWNAKADIPFNSTIKTGILKNGMTYAIKKNAYPEKKANVSLYVKMGSAWEQLDEQGIAHFIEHLAFNGSKNFSKNDVVKYLESIGLTFGGDLNAETGFLHTHYKLEVPTYRTGALDSSLMILSDFAFHMKIDPEDVKNERAIIQNERNLRSSANYKKLYFLAKEITKPSILGDRLPIGDPKVIDTISEKALRSFYEQWYVPENFMVAVVGDVDESEAMKMIQKYFEVDIRNKKVPPRNEILIDSYNGKDLSTFEHPDLSSQVLEVFFTPQKVVPILTKAEYKNQLLEQIALNVLNNRIRETVSSKAGSIVNANLGKVNIGSPYFNYVLSIQMDENKTKNAVNDVFNIIGPWYEHGITNEELKRHIANFQSQVKSVEGNLHRIPSSYYLRTILEWYETGAIPMDLPSIFVIEKELYNQVTVKEINEKIKAFDFSNFKVFVSNKKVDKNQTEGLIELIDQNFKKNYVVQESMEIPKTLLEKKLTPGKIIKETTIPEDSNIKRWELSNGLVVYTQKTDFKKNFISFQAYRKNGFNELPKEQVFDAFFGEEVANVMGFGKFSPVTLKEFLTGKDANVETRLSSYQQMLVGNAQTADMQTMFELIQLKTLYPKIDTVLFRNTMNRYTDAIKSTLNNPRNYLADSVKKVKYGNNIYAGIDIPTPEMLKKVSYQKSYDYYKDVFKTFEGFTFYFIGDYDVDSLKNYVQLYIASLPVSTRKHSITALKDKPIPKNQTLKLVKGNIEGVHYAGEFFGEGKFNQESMRVADVLSAVLSQRIIEVIREDKQYIYSGGVALNILLYPENRFSLRYEMPTKVGYVDSLEIVFKQLLEEVAADGPTDTEVSTAKSQIRNALNTELKENNYWMKRMTNYGNYKYPLVDSETLIQSYESITKEQVKSLLQYVLNNSYHFREILIPEKK